MPIWLTSVAALAQTADFDTLVEGTNGVLILDGGLGFQNLDNRGLSAPPGNIAIDQADATLAGLAGFTAPNALGFGGFSQGADGAFGRFGSMEITNQGLGESAEVTVFENGGNLGTALNLEALLGGVVVASDSEFLAVAGITAHTLTVSGTTFDLLRLSIGPNATDVAFLLVDHVTIVAPPETGDTGTPPVTETADTAAPDTDTDTGGDADTDADSDTDSDVDADTDTDEVPGEDSGAAAKDEGGGCGCRTSGGSMGLLMLAGLVRRRRPGGAR